MGVGVGLCVGEGVEVALGVGLSEELEALGEGEPVWIALTVTDRAPPIAGSWP